VPFLDGQRKTALQFGPKASCSPTAKVDHVTLHAVDRVPLREFVDAGVVVRQTDVVPVSWSVEAQNTCPVLLRQSHGFVDI